MLSPKPLCYNKKISTFNDAVKYLENLEKIGIKFELSRIARVCAYFGDPQDTLKIIHVAGTNGKGSTCAFLDSILRRSGYKVGLYTSPHLTDIRERIRVNGENIRGGDFTRLISSLSSAVGTLKLELTYFEIMTAAAFRHFAERKVDLAIIEVGMGGRLDATNIIKSSLVSIITNIDYEHTQYLGNTLTKIAGEKAAIIKENGIVVTAETKSKPLRVIKRVSLEKKASLLRVGNAGLAGYKLGLAGAHQQLNAVCALTAVKVLRQQGIKIPESAVRKGLAAADWPGRLEVFKILMSNGEQRTVVLDGAHNPAGMKTLAAELRKKGRGYKRKIVIFGVLRDKKYREMIRMLAPLVNRVILVEPDSDRALSVRSMDRQWRGLLGKDRVFQAGTLKSAVSQALAEAKADDLIVGTGSLYTVGEIRKILTGL